MQTYLCTFLILLGIMLHGQQNDPIYIIEGDTLVNPYVDLGEVVVLPNLKFANYKQYLTHYRLKKRTLKVHPYAKIASERLLVLNDRLATIKRKRAKKRHTRRVERYLEDEFKPELKRLSRSEGRILVKLIHRETGNTRSLEALRYLKQQGVNRTKSGLMLGLGESEEEVIASMEDLRNANVDIITLGQYLQPSKKHLPVADFITPEQFGKYEALGLEMGFRHVESGALVRSSYKAHKHIA